jgi:hypothetical protein
MAGKVTTLTRPYSQDIRGVQAIIIDFTADDTDNTFDSITLSPKPNGFVVGAAIAFDTTTPPTSITTTFTDEFGVTFLSDATRTASGRPTISSSIPVNGITVAVSNVGGDASAKFKLIIYMTFNN